MDSTTAIPFSCKFPAYWQAAEWAAYAAATLVESGLRFPLEIRQQITGMWTNPWPRRPSLLSTKGVTGAETTTAEFRYEGGTIVKASVVLRDGTWYPERVEARFYLLDGDYRRLKKGSNEVPQSGKTWADSELAALITGISVPDDGVREKFRVNTFPSFVRLAATVARGVVEELTTGIVSPPSLLAIAGVQQCESDPWREVHKAEVAFNYTGGPGFTVHLSGVQPRQESGFFELKVRTVDIDGKLWGTELLSVLKDSPRGWHHPHIGDEHEDLWKYDDEDE